MVKQYNLRFTEWQAVNESAELLTAHLQRHQVFDYKYFTLTSNLRSTISP